MDKIQNISDILIKYGIKPSYQRIKIYEFISKNHIHPTADTIFKNLINEIPTLSKTTIYNTLKLFEEQKLIRNVKIDGNEVRYDAKNEIHGHFKCDKCGEIYDFDFNHKKLEYKGLENFKLNQTDIFITGICKYCSDKKN